MTTENSVAFRVRGKLRAIAKLLLVAARFVVHPTDFVRLYHRESEVSDTVLDLALISLEDDFAARIGVLEARVAQLEGRPNAAADRSE